MVPMQAKKGEGSQGAGLRALLVSFAVILSFPGLVWCSRNKWPFVAQPEWRQLFFAQTSLRAPSRSTPGYVRRSRLVWTKNTLPQTATYFVNTTPSSDFSTVTNEGIAFVQIPAGTFSMGTTDSQRKQLESQNWWTRFEACEQPSRFITISRAFLITPFEITQAQWTRIMGQNPSAFKGEPRPVESVSWEDVQQFIKKLNETGHLKYRLPTEAEWEYCCRAGSADLYGAGKGELITRENLADYAWFRGNAESNTHPVGEKKPNAWGLYDMHGNVWEWCEDWYAAEFYQKREVKDPLNQAPSTERVLRGGSWFLEVKNLRAAARSGNLPAFKSQYVGFRLVCEEAGQLLRPQIGRSISAERPSGFSRD